MTERRIFNLSSGRLSHLIPGQWFRRLPLLGEFVHLNQPILLLASLLIRLWFKFLGRRLSVERRAIRAGPLPGPDSVASRHRRALARVRVALSPDGNRPVVIGGEPPPVGRTRRASPHTPT